MLAGWVATPVDRIHVLIERKTGKTLSHAFIELCLEDAKVALRTCQNKVLGSGKRTRPVSVTMSTQEELMKEVRIQFTTHESTSNYPVRFSQLGGEGLEVRSFPLRGLITKPFRRLSRMVLSRWRNWSHF